LNDGCVVLRTAMVIVTPVGLFVVSKLGKERMLSKIECEGDDDYAIVYAE
jgi:hypothetical protein